MKFLRREDRRFRPEKVRLPLIALIDVVFFLLIYFVIAGTMAGEEAQLASALRADRKGGGKGSEVRKESSRHGRMLPPLVSSGAHDGGNSTVSDERRSIASRSQPSTRGNAADRRDRGIGRGSGRVSRRLRASGARPNTGR